MSLEDRTYSKYEYLEFPHHPKPPDDFIGPFPSVNFAQQHMQLYGPVGGKIVSLGEPPDSAYLLTPGEHADHVLKRY